jgi:hypothetical protein
MLFALYLPSEKQQLLSVEDYGDTMAAVFRLHRAVRRVLGFLVAVFLPQNTFVRAR